MGRLFCGVFYLDIDIIELINWLLDGEMQIKRSAKIICSIMLLLFSMVGCNHLFQHYTGDIPQQADHSEGLIRESTTPEITEILSTQQINSPLHEFVPAYFLGEEVCPEVKSISSNDNNFTGRLLVVDHDQKHLLFYKLATDEMTPVLEHNEEPVTYAVSPNGFWLAIETLDSDTHQPRLKIISLIDEETISLPWKEGWIRIAYWLDNQRFFIQSTPFDRYDLVLVDPFTDNERTVSFESEDMFNLEWPPDWKGAGPVSYSPDLSYLVFASWNNEYVLAEAKNGETLSIIQYISFHQFPNKSPQWSPDGSTVLVPVPLNSMEYMNDELFAMHTDRTVTRLTNFTEVYERISINRYSWSPDGKKIAVLYSSSGEKEGEQFAIMNFQEQRLIPYCLQADQTNGNYRTNLYTYYDQVIYDGVIWSPDGSQLIVENRIEKNRSTSYLIDLNNHAVYPLFRDENLQVVGWMVDE